MLTLRGPGTNGVAHGREAAGGRRGPCRVPVQSPHPDAGESQSVRGQGQEPHAAHVNNHQVVAMVEIISQGNKNNQNGLNAFVRKAQECAGRRDSPVAHRSVPAEFAIRQGIRRAVWGEDCGDSYVLPDDKPLTSVAYVGGPNAEAFVELVAVGDALPEMPLFLSSDVYVSVPLEPTYLSAWEGMPGYWREVLTRAP